MIIKYEDASKKEWRVNEMIGLLPPIRAITRINNKYYLSGGGFTKKEAKQNLIKAIKDHVKILDK